MLQEDVELKNLPRLKHFSSANFQKRMRQMQTFNARCYVCYAKKALFGLPFVRQSPWVIAAFLSTFMTRGEKARYESGFPAPRRLVRLVLKARSVACGGYPR